VAANNAANIAGNAGSIASNAGNIANNAANIGKIGEAAVNNAANIAGNAGNVAANAGNIANNAANIGKIGGVAANNAANIANNANAIGTLSGNVAANAQNIAGLTSTVGMLSGSVASNTATIATMGAQVAVLSEAAAPTVALASMMGLSVGTVSSIALAGSLAGPLLGCVALVAACWPAEETDPWMKVESRVARMIDDRFKQERRQKLSTRLKRYISEFSSCAHEWTTLAGQQTADGSAPGNEAASFLSTWQGAMHHASRKELDLGETISNMAVTASEGSRIPKCMSELVTTMSLERDEWMSSGRKESLSGLFMPFANMHTQILAALTDYSGDDRHVWSIKQQKTAAEYASFILSDISDAWKKQVCRTVRLRHSLNAGLTWQKYKYMFVTLEPMWQPNAGDTCLSQCKGEAGWCNFCGGKGVGACCRRGGVDKGLDPMECKQFDVFGGEEEPVCVHTDCAQSSSKYEEKWGRSGLLVAQTQAEGASACQVFCQTAHLPEKSVDAMEAASKNPKTPASVFNYKRDGKCQCLSGKVGAHGDFVRHLRKNEYISGPVYCPTGQVVGGEEDEEQDNEMATVPMKEVLVCDEKSAPVNDVHDLEKTQQKWVKECSANATAQVIKDFNPFYQRFAKFVERLAWVSGCGDVQNDAAVDVGLEEDDWNGIIVDFPFGTFDECNWHKESKRNDDKWIPDSEKTRGWFGQSKINMQEQAMMRIPYAAPGWLIRLMKKYNCLARTSRHDVGDGKSAAFEAIFSGR
jgi:hypothetical protein